MFTSAEKIMVINFLLETTCFDEIYDDETDQSVNENVGIHKLIQNGVFEKSYPLHDSSLNFEENSMRTDLNKHWAPFKKWYKLQPLDHVKNYFGVKTGLYFAWVDFYTNFLFFATLLGLIPFIYGLTAINDNPIIEDLCGDNSSVADTNICPLCDTCSVSKAGTSCSDTKISEVLDNKISWIYAILVCIWAGMFVEFWKRKQFKLIYSWDLTDLVANGTARIEYKMEAKKRGVYKRNPATFVYEKYVKSKVKKKRQIFSWVILLCWLAIVVISICGSVLKRRKIAIP